MTKGKVVLVPFPFDDMSSSKVRPAVCLTEPLGPHRHIILAFITSETPAGLLDSDIVLDSSAGGFARTGLKMTATLRLHRIMTVTSSLIRRELGELSPDIQNEVTSKLLELFALPTTSTNRRETELSESSTVPNALSNDLPGSP